MKFKSKLAAVTVSCGMSFSAQAAMCPPFNEIVVMAQMAAVEAALKTLFQTLIGTLSKGLLAFDKQDMSAIKVVTSQVSTAARAQINSDIALAQGEMAALGHLERSKQQLKVYQDYSALTGQGVDPCAQMTAQSNVTTARNQAFVLAGDNMGLVDAGPGRYGNMEDFMRKMLKLRQTAFGTADDEALGYGKATKEQVVTATGAKFALAGADANAGVLFADSSDPRIILAKNAFLNHMAGAPDAPIAQDMAGLPAGKEYMAKKGRKDAVMSAAVYSLAMVSAENTPSANGKSKSQAMRELVGQYYGASAQPRWIGWTSQSVRGVMVDQLKIDAASLAIKAEQYNAGQRTEVLLGSLLAAQTSREYTPALAAAAANLDNLMAKPALR